MIVILIVLTNYFSAQSPGRDTPSSQITEGEDGRVAGEVRQLDLPPPNIPTKQSRSEIDDKFCKFEIKKLIEGKYKLTKKIYK